MRPAILWITLCVGMAAVAWAQPQSFYERYEAGRAQLDKAEFEAAVATLNSALAGVPAGQAPDPNIYVALGYAQMRLGRFDEAESNFNLAEQSKLTPTSREQLQANRQVLRQLRGH